MQQGKTIKYFKKKIGESLKEIRLNKYQGSINKIANEYDIDKGNLSKLERGFVGCTILTAWKICEASGIKFSEFAKILEHKLGEKFKLTED